MSTSRPSYAIIGGGIAGLTLAIALHKRNIPVVIYEQAQHFGEIGAGVAFTHNAVESMKLCDQGIYDAFAKVATHNQWESKKNVWFDFMDGMDNSIESAGHQDSIFQITSKVGVNGVHRAKFLDEMVNLVPEGTAKFGKHLDKITELDSGKLQMIFHDGTSAEADAIIGCDGIKSQVRRILVGEDSPMAKHVYTYKYAYRGLIEMDKAVEAIGEERARNSCLWMGQDGHILTFGVNQGETLNLVAFRTTTKDWPDPSKSTLPVKREEALKDFEAFGPNVLKLLELTKPDLDVWGIFDIGNHPLETFNKGKICLVGDAAHATSPHHGAGAGFCIEDVAVLTKILEQPGVTGENHSVEAAFDTFTAVRKHRTQWLVQHSRRQGNLYEWRAEGVGKDFKKIEQEINESNGYIENVDVAELCEQAKQELEKRLKN